MIRSPWFATPQIGRDGVLADATPDDVLTLAMALCGFQDDVLLPAEDGAAGPSPSDIPGVGWTLPVAAAMPATPVSGVGVPGPQDTPDGVQLAPEPQPSPEDMDLFAQFAGMYADFSGDQALSDLLGSDWAVQNGWQAAGGAPLG